MRLRSKSVVLSAVFTAMIPAITACSQDSDADTSEICMDNETEIRVDDQRCESGDSGTSWVYIHGHAPSVGSRVPKGYSTVKTGIVGRSPHGGGAPISSGG